jgi:hypothetical protein
MFNYPIASSRYNNAVVFFGKGFDSRTVYVVNQFDRAVKLDVEFESDIVSLYASDRTLFVVSNSGLTTVAISDVYKKAPKYKEIQIASVSGSIRTVFQVDNRLYGITASNVIEINSDGDVIGNWTNSRNFDLSVYQRVGNIDVLYLGNKSELSAYQWYSGEKKAILAPVYGYLYESYESSTSSQNTLSGSSKINDNDVYQDFSFGVELEETTDSYMKNFKSLVNPAGYKIFGVYEKTLNYDGPLFT